MINSVNSIIMLLSKAMANRKLYFSDHPRVNSFSTDVVDLLEEYFKASSGDFLFIGVVDGFFIFDGKRIFGPSITGKPLIKLAETLNCGGFSFSRGITVKDLKKFLDITALRNIPVKKHSEAQALLEQYGVKSIRVGEQFNEEAASPRGGAGLTWEGQRVDGSVLSPAYLFQELYDVVSSSFGDAALDHSLDIDRAKSVSEFMLRYIQSSFADVMQHLHYPDYDSYTVGHSVRVASLAVYVGSRMGWGEKDLLRVGAAGLLHDIGKCRVPDAILFKNGKLNDEEFTHIRSHPQQGVAILLEQEHITPIDLAACWGHHIRHDGRGYPEQPAWAIRNPVTALLQICDVFEALTAIRPYKPAIEPQGAYTIMVGDKGGFHPGLLAAFISIVSLYPPGTYVQLADQRVGMVLETSKFIDRPKLIITTTQSGEPLPDQDQYLLDLSEPRQQGVQVEKLLLDYLA